MNEVRRRWPEATTEMDASVEAPSRVPEFHDRVATDDLPRFEDEFKRQLNVNTIRELAQFNSWLRRQSDEIQPRVDRINEALGAIDYSPGRYIRLDTERTSNTEVQDFRTELRAPPTIRCRPRTITMPSDGSSTSSGSSSGSAGATGTPTPTGPGPVGSPMSATGSPSRRPSETA